MRFIFFNSYQEIRSGWKIALVYILHLMILLGLAYIWRMILVLLSIAGEFVVRGPQEVYDLIFENSSLIQNIAYFGSTLAMFIAILMMLKFFDRKSFSDIGFPSIQVGGKDLGIGLFLGALSMTGIFLVLWATGSVNLKNSLLQPHLSSTVLWGMLFFIMVGIQEEIFVRGYVLSVLKQTRLPRIPAVLSAIIFSLLHGLNPNVSGIGLLNIFLVGLLFAYMVIISDSIWMAIGYHITWNYFQGYIFSFPVSGMSQEGIYSIQVTGNPLFTGGAFGPEGGILTTIVIVMIFLVLRFLYVPSHKRESRSL